MSRHSDRVESVTAVCLLAAFVISLPLAAWAGHHLYRVDSAAARIARNTGHYTNAVLLEDAPAAAGVDGATADPWVKARWYTQDGTRHVGQIRATPGDQAGTRVPLWLNAKGTQAQPPAGSATIVANAIGFGVTIVFAAAFVLEAVRRGVRRLLDRSRLHGWEAEWAQIGPRWTRRTR